MQSLRLKTPWILSGDGTRVVLKAAEELGCQAYFLSVDTGASALRPEEMARMAYQRYSLGERPTWQEAHAHYISPSQAERLHG